MLALAAALPSFNIVSMGGRPRPAKRSERSSAGFGRGRKEQLWQCVEGCGACCKLNKGPSFATPEEVFDDPSDVQVTSQSFFFFWISCCVLFLFKLSIFSFTEAWLDQMDGAYTMRKVHANALYTPVSIHLVKVVTFLQCVNILVYSLIILKIVALTDLDGSRTMC